jgi:hypothetical protein
VAGCLIWKLREIYGERTEDKEASRRKRAIRTARKARASALTVDVTCQSGFPGRRLRGYPDRRTEKPGVSRHGAWNVLDALPVLGLGLGLGMKKRLSCKNQTARKARGPPPLIEVPR